MACHLLNGNCFLKLHLCNKVRTGYLPSNACKPSALCFLQVSELVNQEAGHLHKDSIVLACDILECSPWFDFVDLDTYDATDVEVCANRLISSCMGI